MTESITLTRDAYIRYHLSHDWTWERLVEESKRREKIVRWVEIQPSGAEIWHKTEPTIILKTSTLIKLVEEIGEEK